MKSSGNGNGNGGGGAVVSSQQQQQQVYSFPLLKPSDLIACIREMQIPVTEEEIRNCDIAAIRKILEVFIENTMGVSREEMNQPQFAGLSVLSYPELHEDSIPELTFFRQANKLMQACGVYDFGMKDLLAPNPKRVRRQLSALINFAKFRDERVAAFAELTRETEILSKQKLTLQEENELLQRQLQELLSEQVAEEPAIQQLTQDNAQLEAEINGLNKKQAVMRHENNELKAKYQELKDEMASFQFNVIEADKQIHDLHSKIVNSPERVKKEISQIAITLEGAKDELNAMERRFRELQMYSDTFTRSEKDIMKTVELMEEIENDMKKCKDAKEQVKSQTKEIDDNRRQALEIISQRKRLEKLADQKREHFELYKDESKIKDQAADQALKGAQDELRVLESTHADANKRITSHKDHARELERKKRDEELKYQKELHDLKQMYSRLQMAAQYYNTQLSDAIRGESESTEEKPAEMEQQEEQPKQEEAKEEAEIATAVQGEEDQLDDGGRETGSQLGNEEQEEIVTDSGEEHHHPANEEKEQEQDIVSSSFSEVAQPAPVAVAYSIDNDPQLDVSAAYEPTTLVRPLQQWELARDHLIFGDLCGFDAGKRHWVHVLEPPTTTTSSNSEHSHPHGGILLTAAGNTVQILTLAPSPDAAQIRGRASNVIHRKYLFGTSGSGIGALAIHPSRRFFAVAEKGRQPAICVYQYPSTRVCCVLRNGTERSYSSVCFSGDGETLASLGGAPDFLLTVWHWRNEQTILRCKAFGQDIFSVRFAPHDSGFLTTSGVGHIRFWKMASTFTGLKLQGDIGKFGKSELSDIEAFCVLPDKKVLSGTERGVLLLWDGNFIKCEIMTTTPHEPPHRGNVNVVQYEPESQQIVTAGKDGVVRFWNFDAIDKADVLPDESVAFVKVKRTVVIKKGLDLRGVVGCGPLRYLVQSSDGSVHLLLLKGADNDDEDGDDDPTTYDVVLDYVANPTGGGANAVACSPYEHLAASCGVDGSVRAWDYVHREFLFSVSTTVFAKEDNGETKSDWTAQACSIVWVPTASALVQDPHLPASRQVVVGFSDGLVRVLLLDLARKSFVRTNVFKPHKAHVRGLVFSHSGRFLATSSADATFFLFKIVASTKSSKLVKFPPEYAPLGFQRVASEIKSLVWREDDAAVLLTLANGAAVEYQVPMDGSLEALAEKRGGSSSTTTETTTETTTTETTGESETYELHLESRAFTSLERHRPLSTKELDVLESAATQPQIEDVVKRNFHAVDATNSVQAYAASYYDGDSILLSVKPSSSTAAAGGAVSTTQTRLLLCEWGKSVPIHEFASEPTCAITTLALSGSGKYILCGLANGKFQLRTFAQPQAFLTGEFHDGSHIVDARTCVATSFDDSFVVSCGADGNVAICRLHTENVELGARLLDEKHDKLIVEATIVGEQAMEKQRAQLDLMQKAAAAEEARNNEDDGSGGGGGASTGGSGNGQGTSSSELASLPSFHRAKAFALYLETQLLDDADPSSSSTSSGEPGVAKDSENFGGVVRLMTDANNTLGMPLAAPPPPNGVDATGPVLSMLEVADVTNPKDAYTIEDAKRQSEADARALSTRSKQDRTRDVVEQMRTQLDDLKSLDASYPQENRLDADEWEIDLDYGDLLVQQGDQACDEVKKELAFAVEHDELLLMKMRETYVSQVAVELLTLHAFESGLKVQSFRTMKMPPLLQKRLNEIHTHDAIRSNRATTMLGPIAGAGHGHIVAGTDAMAQVPLQRRPSVLHIMAKDAELDESFPLHDDERQLMQQQQLQRSASGKTGVNHQPPGAPLVLGGALVHVEPPVATGASVHGFEARKRLRGERKERLQQWLRNKPGEDADDPRDLVAIAFAQRNMGDYKLKTAPNYVVPQDQRVNAAKKRRQMALLEEQIYEAKLTFNAKVLELRELKLLLIQEMKSDQERERVVHSALRRLTAESQHKQEQEEMMAVEIQQLKLEVDLSEWPEQRERVSDSDLELYLQDKTVRPHSVLASSSSGHSTASSSGRRSSVSLPNEVVIDGKRVELSDRSLAAVSRKLHDPTSGTSTGSSDPGPGEMAPSAGGITTLRVRHVGIDDLAAVPSDFLNNSSRASAKHRPPVDDAELAIRVYLLKQELTRLARKQRDEITAFDDAVAHLRREKMRLDVAFKKCELKLFTLLSELVLLEQFENRENLLSSKLEKSKSEKALIVAEIHDIQENLSHKKKDVEEWSKQEKTIQAEFLTMVNGPSNGGSSSSSTTAQHPNFSALQKIFKKKIKRPKKKTIGGSGGGGGPSKDGKDGDGGDPSHDGDGGSGAGGGGGGDDEDEDDEDDDNDSDYDDDDDDDDDDDEEEDVCPSGCDLQLYEKVLALREKRADVDDAMLDLTKAMDELKKSNDRQVAKQRQIDKELQATELDIQLFQSEKQMRFNQLDIVVALSKQQIRCLEAKGAIGGALRGVGGGPGGGGGGRWELPEQATSSLVFSVKSFEALAERIESLQKENKSLRQQFKDLHKQQNLLAKEKKIQQDKIAQIQQKCEQLQLLKFGQLVDIELLDKACDTSRVGELQAKVRSKEMDSEREIARVKQSQQECKLQILRATEQNTALLTRIAELNARQFELEKELNHANVSQSILQDESEQVEREMHERNKLVKIVKLQAREVDALKQEIGLLRGKDGKVYAPRG